MTLSPILTALDDGTSCELACPEDGNGYLISQPDLWHDALNDAVQTWLWDHGYATIRHSRDIRQWNVEQALRNETEALDAHRARFGRPRKGTIVWGGSMGGLVTRLLIETFPERYAGAIPMDGGGAGTLATFNRGFDMAYVVAMLLTHTPPVLVGAADGRAEIRRLEALVRHAVDSASGRARIALAAAIGGTPVWSDPSLPRPDDGDPQQEAEHLARGILTTLPQAYAYRLNLEEVAGGVFVSNDELDYARILADSGDRQRVQHLYDIAGSSLQRDLDRLAAAARVTAEPAAVDRLTQRLAVTGDVSCPVLVLKGVGDPDAVSGEEHAYAERVARHGRTELVRWAWVDTPGHLNFTLAERVAALTCLVERIETGTWSGSTTPVALNARAKELAVDDRYDFTVYGACDRAPGIDLGLSRFVGFAPRPFARADG